MSYIEFKQLCTEAWKEKYTFLETNMLQDRNESKCKICNEFNPNYEIFIPQTATF